MDSPQQASGHTIHAVLRLRKNARCFSLPPLPRQIPTSYPMRSSRLSRPPPQTRYVAANAKSLVLMSTFMPDRFNDWLMSAITKNLLKQQREKSATQTV
jgi:hypothetical protein